MGLNKTPVWRGAKALVEDETSPKVVQTPQGIEITQTYTGPYAECMSKRPRPGSEVKGFKEAFVTRTEVVRAPGGQGKLTVSSESQDLGQDGAGGAGPQAGAQQVEVEWVRYDRPLAQHPKFSSLTTEDLKKIEDYVQSKGGTYNGPTTEAATEFLILRMRGTESYMLFAPVVRRITPHDGPPTTSTAGKISSPPFNPGSFQFVKSADRSVRQNGRWERVEEWIGADVWSSYLYADS